MKIPHDIILRMKRKKEHIGVSIVTLNDKDQILLGGRIELNEPLINTVKRELLEETGVEAEIINYIGIVRELQKSYTFIHFGFLVKKIKGEPKNMETSKCKGWNWYSFDKLPNNILPGHKAILEIHLNPDAPSYKDLI